MASCAAWCSTCTSQRGPGRRVSWSSWRPAAHASCWWAWGGDAGEHGVDLPAFAEPFPGRARALGLRTTMHLGEEGPVEDIRVGVHELGLERIDHGTSLLEDPALVHEVAERRIPVTSCPTSNLRIGVVARLEDHPVLRQRAAGVLATVHSDNAAMFGIDLADELCNLRDAFGLGRAELESLCLDGVEASWLDEADKRALRATFLAEMAATR